MDSAITGIVWLVAFVFSVSAHEAAHAWVAKLGGDPTAYEGGHVSLDPMPHIRREPFGMLVLPILSLLYAGWPIGYASAPYDPRWAERYPRRAAWMALAGPAANLALVLVCAGAIWLGVGIGELAAPSRAFASHIVTAVHGGVWDSVGLLLSILFTLNLLLFLFNLIPLPPLDGAGALGLLLSHEAHRRVRELQAQPAFSIFGLLIAWYIFRSVFDPMFALSLRLLYPGSGYH
jgi:Zn-dependent protease